MLLFLSIAYNGTLKGKRRILYHPFYKIRKNDKNIVKYIL